MYSMNAKDQTILTQPIDTSLSFKSIRREELGRSRAESLTLARGVEVLPVEDAPPVEVPAVPHPERKVALRAKQLPTISAAASPASR